MAHSQPADSPAVPLSKGDSPTLAQQQALTASDGTMRPASKPKEAKVSYMSLPHKGQLAILCLARLADPLATTSIQV